MLYCIRKIYVDTKRDCLSDKRNKFIEPSARNGKRKTLFTRFDSNKLPRTDALAKLRRERLNFINTKIVRLQNGAESNLFDHFLKLSVRENFRLSYAEGIYRMVNYWQVITRVQTSSVFNFLSVIRRVYGNDVQIPIMADVPGRS